MKLRTFAKLITALARAEAGHRVTVEIGQKCWWYTVDGEQRGYEEGYFVPVNKDETIDEAGRDWEQDLVDNSNRDYWSKLDVPAEGEYTADFYIYTPDGYGDVELDTNVVVTFQNGRPVSAVGTGGNCYTIDPNALTFERTGRINFNAE